MMGNILIVFTLLHFGSIDAAVRGSGTPKNQQEKLTHELVEVRRKILRLEKKVIQSLKGQSHARSKIKELRYLQKLQKKELKLTQARMKDLSGFVSSLELRRNELSKKVKSQRRRIQESLIEIRRSMQPETLPLPSPDMEMVDAPRRRVLARLVDRNFREIESLQADLIDAEYLESRIETEKQHLSSLLQDLEERKSLLRFHKRLQVDILKANFQDRLKSLEDYNQMKEAEASVGQLINQFNARIELEEIEKAQKRVSREIFEGTFLSQKGNLPFPVSGRVISDFGRSTDPNTKLSFFRKGVEISSDRAARVRAVFEGRVVFSGVLPGYEQVVILDHGANYYSLCAHLGKIFKKEGDLVEKGDVVGLTDRLGTPIYFEIRSRNVAVNPRDWLEN